MKTQKTATVTLKRSGGGVFEITVDGRLAYSKKATGEFPTDEEVKTAMARLIRAMTGSQGRSLLLRR
jgi:selT/selW/selH-like putative selenoprotein